ncbi:hypothetical protein AB0I93_03040 [Streptomyces sp. NPDC049967]|uniref:hypothetical protein n=1 Tax=Streptomyces sp. NPDC049967 TaxID=3155658 RepID=UPI003415CE28
MTAALAATAVVLPAQSAQAVPSKKCTRPGQLVTDIPDPKYYYVCEPLRSQ